MSSETGTYKILYVVTVVAALGIGFFAGVELNPKPTQVILEKTVEKTIIEKEVPVEVVVERQVDELPKEIRSKFGGWIDCESYLKDSNFGLSAVRKWKFPKKDLQNDPDGLYWKSRMAERSALYYAIKMSLITKIQCRAELTSDEFDLVVELVSRPEILDL